MLRFVNQRSNDQNSTPSHFLYLIKECCMKIHIFSVFTWIKKYMRGILGSIRFSLSKLHVVR